VSLQVYFSGVVVPAVSTSVAELSSASSALLSLIRAVEDSITVVLRKCVDAFSSEVRGMQGGKKGGGWTCEAARGQACPRTAADKGRMRVSL
jgi:hypothetical protein